MNETELDKLIKEIWIDNSSIREALQIAYQMGYDDMSDSISFAL